MPLPLILIPVAAGAAAIGAGLGVLGGSKMKKAKETQKKVQEQDKKNHALLEDATKSACASMDELGKNEIEILSGFEQFSQCFEKIHMRPEFVNIKIGNVSIPKFDIEELKKTSVGASILVNSLGSAALGTAGGFAASGATTAAIAALGVASTGTPIAALSGAAATNATLAVLGGGTLAAGGGGIALGSIVLSATAAGIGLLVGGAIFSIAGQILSNKADEAQKQMLENKQQTDVLCDYLKDLQHTAEQYTQTLLKMRSLYDKQLDKMCQMVTAHEDSNQHVDWNTLSKGEKLIVENMVLIVQVLYDMCKVQFVLSSKSSDQKVINKDAIHKAEKAAQDTIEQMTDK